MRTVAKLIALVTPKKKRVAWKRTPEEDARIYGPKEFREWLHRQPCAVCGWHGIPETMEQMHVKTGGVGRKADWTFTISACSTHWDKRFPKTFIRGCHRASHQGQKSFEAKTGVNLLDLAAKTQRDWNAYRENE